MNYGQNENDSPEKQAPSEINSEIQQQIGVAINLFQKDVTTKTLLDSLGQGVVVIDNEGYVLYVNSRAEKLFGYSGNEIIGQHHDKLVPPRLKKIHEDHMAFYFKEPKVRPMGLGMNLSGMHKNGSEFPIEISLSYLTIKNSILVLALITDITIRVDAEKALKQRAIELEAANNALESFSYSVSHDLRNPLSIISSFSKILYEDYNESLDSAGREYLERIIANASHMNDLINDMLGLAKVSRQDIVVKKVDLGEVARLVISELQQTQPDRKVEVVIENNLYMQGDEKLIRIALANLLGNAWKYTGKVQNPQIYVGAQRSHNRTIFFIRDNGVGFDMKFSSKLFIPFQRLHQEKEFSGTGVGLAITARVVVRHHGKIWAESSPGKGATFYFEFDT